MRATSRSWAVAVLGLLACATVQGAEPSVEDAAAPPQGAAPEVLGPWISFYASFDDGVAADLATGAAAPKVTGRTAIVDGLRGGAVKVGAAGGGARLDYLLAGNVDLSRPGGLSFWFSPRGWTQASSRTSSFLRFVRFQGEGRSSFVVQHGARARGMESLMVGFFDLPTLDKHFLQYHVEPLWQPGSWHLIAVSWDPAGFGASVDGAPFTRKGVPGGRIETSFGSEGARSMVVGDRAHEFWLMDELTVYSRALREEDAARLWERGRRDAAGRRRSVNPR